MKLRSVGLALVGVISVVGIAGCGIDAGDPVARAEAPTAGTASAAAEPGGTVESTMPQSTLGLPPVTDVAATDALATDVPVTELPAAVVPATDVPRDKAEISPYLSAFCPTTPRAVAVDRDRQRAWLCDEGRAVYEFPLTGAITQPDAGTYPVYAKDLEAFSTLSGPTSFMTHFVAFTYGKQQGARIAFHSVPTYRDGSSVQPWESVGEPSMRGQSAGCLRVLPDDAVRVWDWLEVGDEVRVIN